MKSRKGSITVIALIMLLFLVIVCGAWIVMMTQEKTNAFADEKQQQAWYAAEAGYKRAAVLLTQSKANWDDKWDWTTKNYDNFKNGNVKKINLKNLSEISSTDKDSEGTPWYAVNINEITSDSYSYPTAGLHTFTIRAMGEYMGERKIIERTVTLTVKSSGGSGGGSSSGTIISGTRIVEAGGTVTVDNSVAAGDGDSNGAGVTGQIAAGKGIVEERGKYKYGKNSDKIDYTTGNIATPLPTKIAITAFAESTYGIFTKLSEVTAGAGWGSTPLTLENNSLTKISWPINWHYKDQWNDRSGVFQYKIIGGNGAILYVNLAGSSGYTNMYFEQGIWGPSSGEPLTLIFDDDVYINGEIHGNVRIIAKGNVYLGNRPMSGKIMVVANGDVIVAGSTSDALMFISSNGNVELNSSGSKFYGQIQAAGSVLLSDNKNVLNTTVATEFKMPEMEYN